MFFLELKADPPDCATLGLIEKITDGDYEAIDRNRAIVVTLDRQR